MNKTIYSVIALVVVSLSIVNITNNKNKQVSQLLISSPEALAKVDDMGYEIIDHAIESAYHVDLDKNKNHAYYEIKFPSVTRNNSGVTVKAFGGEVNIGGSSYSMGEQTFKACGAGEGDCNEPTAWEWYSDMYKLVYGRRPRN